MREQDRANNQNALLAVMEHFPHRESVIDRLIKWDEKFRATSQQLFDVKTALACRSDHEMHHEDQRAELLELTGRLVGELLASLIAHGSRNLKD